MPVTWVPLVGPIAADMLDPVLRVLVEAGYDRTTSPGQPTPFNPLYFPDPATLTTNLLIAVPTGLDNGLQDLGLGRVAGTTPVSNPYGVGGPTANTSTPPAIVSTANEPATVVDPTPDRGSPTDQQVVANTSPTSGTTPQDDPTATPEPPATLVSRPQPPLLRGPIGGSPSSPGASGIASSVTGVISRTTTAISGVVGSVTTAAGDAVSAATGNSATSSSPEGGSPGGDASH